MGCVSVESGARRGKFTENDCGFVGDGVQVLGVENV
jgi:hypothetical protein